jgi:hypothetical protein
MRFFIIIEASTSSYALAALANEFAYRVGRYPFAKKPAREIEQEAC